MSGDGSTIWTYVSQDQRQQPAEGAAEAEQHPLPKHLCAEVGLGTVRRHSHVEHRLALADSQFDDARQNQKIGAVSSPTRFAPEG